LAIIEADFKAGWISFLRFAEPTSRALMTDHSSLRTGACYMSEVTYVVRVIKSYCDTCIGLGKDESAHFNITQSRPSCDMNGFVSHKTLFHYLLLRSYLYYCVWSVITAHNLTPEKRDNNYLPHPLTPTSCLRKNIKLISGISPCCGCL